MIMFSSLVIYAFVASISLLDVSSGSALKRVIRETGSAKCGTSDTPQGIVDSQKNVTLDSWPWDCINSHINSSALTDLIYNTSSVYDAASKGYIGIVQYYGEKTNVSLADRNHDGETPLHLAAENGRLPVVKYLSTKLSARDMDMYNDNFYTPLMGAAYRGQLDILKFLYDAMKADSAYRESDKDTLLRWAARGGQLTVLQYLVDTKNFTVESDDSPLLIASAVGGNVELIKYLINTKNLEARGKESNTGNTPLHKAALKGRLEAVKFFVDTVRYSVNSKNNEEDTPAHSAVSGGSLPVLKFLIDEGHGNVNAVNQWGHSLLHTAAFEGYLDVVKYLVDEKKLSTELRDNTGRTPIYQAVHEGRLDVVKYLAEEKRANIKGKSNERGLLHEAVYSKSVEMMKYLLDDLKMIDRINEVDNYLKRTPAAEAAYWGQLTILRFLLDERKANASLVDWEGHNLLHIAARSGKLDIVKYLVEEKNFDVNAKTTDGKTVYDWALRFEYYKEDLLKYLRQKMKPELLPNKN